MQTRSLITSVVENAKQLEPVFESEHLQHFLARRKDNGPATLSLALDVIRTAAPLLPGVKLTKGEHDAARQNT
jgi:hypothetical protein